MPEILAEGLLHDNRVLWFVAVFSFRCSIVMLTLFRILTM